MYEKEVVDQQAKVDRMIAENKDEYDIRKQVSHTITVDCGFSLLFINSIDRNRKMLGLQKF